jgi:hypothetical protein
MEWRIDAKYSLIIKFILQVTSFYRSMRGFRISEDSLQILKISTFTLYQLIAESLQVIFMSWHWVQGLRVPWLWKVLCWIFSGSGLCTIDWFVTVLFNLYSAYRRAIMSIMAVRKKGKVFLFLCVKAYRRSRGLAPLFCNLGSRRWLEVNFTFRSLYHRKNNH